MEVWTDRQQNVPTRQHNRTDPRGRSHTILTSPGAQHLSIQHLQGKQTLPAPTTHQTCDLSSLTPPTKHNMNARSWMVSWFKKKTKNTPLDGDHTYCTHHYTQIDIVPIRSCHEALVCCYDVRNDTGWCVCVRRHTHMGHSSLTACCASLASPTHWFFVRVPTPP